MLCKVLHINSQDITRVCVIIIIIIIIVIAPLNSYTALQFCLDHGLLLLR